MMRTAAMDLDDVRPRAAGALARRREYVREDVLGQIGPPIGPNDADSAWSGDGLLPAALNRGIQDAFSAPVLSEASFVTHVVAAGKWMVLRPIDASALVTTAEVLRESASLHETLGLVVTDVALRQRAAQQSALRRGLNSQLTTRAAALTTPGSLEAQCVASADYLSILRCLVRGEIALAARRLEDFDAKLVDSIARCLTRRQLSTETASVLRLVAPLFQVTNPQHESPSRNASR